MPKDQQPDIDESEHNPEMGSYENIIISVLSESTKGYTTNELAKTTRISRTTIIKYLSVLKERGIADYVMVGPSKLWFSKSADSHNNTISYRA